MKVPGNVRPCVGCTLGSVESRPEPGELNDGEVGRLELESDEGDTGESGKANCSHGDAGGLLAGGGGSCEDSSEFQEKERGRERDRERDREPKRDREGLMLRSPKTAARTAR